MLLQKTYDVWNYNSYNYSYYNESIKLHCIRRLNSPSSMFIPNIFENASQGKRRITINKPYVMNLILISHYMEHYDADKIIKI